MLEEKAPVICYSVKHSRGTSPVQRKEIETALLDAVMTSVSELGIGPVTIEQVIEDPKNGVKAVQFRYEGDLDDAAILRAFRAAEKRANESQDE